MIVKPGYKYSDLTSKIIGCAMEVHNCFGSGYQEVIYQKALAIELKQAGIPYQKEFEMDIYYRDEHIGIRKVDFLVDNLISVELKAVKILEDAHFAQGLNYLEIGNMEIGMLINFGEQSLVFKRLINNKYRPGCYDLNHD